MVHLAAANRKPFPISIFFLTFASAVITIAAASHALVARNHDVGEASYTASLGGIYLIISTNPITQPGYALSVAAGGIVINALSLLLNSFFGITKFFRRHFWILLVGAYFNVIFILATAIAVLYEARNGQLSLYATVRATGAVVPAAVLQAQAGAIGLTLDFWGKDYVKFMAISGIITAVLSIPHAFFAHRYYQFVKAYEASEKRHLNPENGLNNVVSNEKATNQHIENRI